MKHKKTVFAFFSLYILIITMVYAITQTGYITFTHNFGEITGIGVGVYEDPSCTIPVTQIDWSPLRPGENKTRLVYIRNEGNENVSLTLSTANWVPTDASLYITLSWNYSGQILEVNKVIAVEFVLKVSRDIRVSNFAFDTFFIANKARLTDWLMGWSYRRAVTINNMGNPNTLTDYQVLVTVNTQNPISEGKMQLNGADIRFTDSDGTTPLKFWIELGINTPSTKIWVKVPTIPGSDTKTIYMYYGKPDASSASDGRAVFDEFDDFEFYAAGSLSGQLAGAWSKYVGNPVLSPEGTEGSTTFGSVLLDGNTYHLYYLYLNAAGKYVIGHATSSDGINWVKDSVHNPVLQPSQPFDANEVRTPMVWKEGTTWYMIYTGASEQVAIGLATSVDGVNWIKEPSNPVLQGDIGQWDAGDTENWGVIKIGSTYYLWYSKIGQERKIGLATSTNLKNWVKDPNNPIFTGDRFCPFPFKYEDYYYLLVPHYTIGSDYAQQELYRDKNPTFYPADRELVRSAAIPYGSTGQWDDLDTDTPSVLTNDITRSSFPNNELWVYYSAQKSDLSWRMGLTIEKDISKALSKVSWTVDESAGSITVVNSPTWQGSRSVNQHDTSLTLTTRLTTSVATGTKTIIGAWMRRSTESGGYYDIYLYQDNTLALVVGFGDNGYFHYWSGSFQSTTVSFSANTYYLIVAEVNSNIDEYNFVVYDQSLIEILRVNSISFGNVVTKINKVLLYTSMLMMGDGYMDNFRARQYAIPEPSTSVGIEET